MTTLRTSQSVEGAGAFPFVRRGYDRDVVDEFTRQTQAEIVELRRQRDALNSQNTALHAALTDSRARVSQVDLSSVGGRAQEILGIAEEQARDVTQRAEQEADQLLAETYADVVRTREAAAAELAEVRERELAELAYVRERGEQDLADLMLRTQVDADQLLAAARLQADAVRAEAAAHAEGLIQSATLESQRLLAAARQQANALAQETDAQRERVLASLVEAQAAANQTRDAMLAKATQQQRASGAQLSAEAEQAARMRRESLAEAEQAKIEATNEADRIVGYAQQQAATIDERAQQEFAWRRRQMRHEQDLLTRRRQAMLSQLTSLSTLALQTAEDLPEVPELSLSDFDEPEQDGPTELRLARSSPG